GGRVSLDAVGLLWLVVEHARRVAIAGEDEGAIVEATFGAKALGQPPAPGPLLAARLVAGTRDDVLQALERLQTRGVAELGADEDVLVREGQHRSAQLVVHERPQGGVSPTAALD